MVKEELVEGLKLALSKGESLQSAMMTFYNAGYTKTDIEEAARAMEMPQLTQMVQANTVQGQTSQQGQVQQAQTPQTQQQSVVQQPQQSVQNNEQQTNPVSQAPPDKEYNPQQQTQTQALPPPQQQVQQRYPYYAYPSLQQQSTQRVSAYGNTDIEPPNKTLVGSLLVILVLLFAALVGLFVFKNQIINFLNNLIG